MQCLFEMKKNMNVKIKCCHNCFFLGGGSQRFFCFMFWFFGREACGMLAPRPGIEPTPPALEGKVLTTGPPGKSLKVSLIKLQL